MFENLIESKPKKDKTIGQTVSSVIFHSVLIFAAVKATSGVAQAVKKITDKDMMFIKPPEPPPPPPPPPPEAANKAPPPQGFQTIVPPKGIPTEIPPINLNEKFNAKDFSGKGIEGGIASGLLTAAPTVSLGESYTVDQVDDPVVYDGGPEPKYPPPLRAAGIEGRVTLRFVVGADGRVEGNTVSVVSTTNQAFVEPAIEAIKASKFKPAKVKGQAVRQLVEQAVSFKIT